MKPKVFANKLAGSHATIKAPRKMDIPCLVETPEGIKTEFRPFMNCDSFALAGAVGASNGETKATNVLLVQMQLGESGLFQLMDLEEARQMHKKLGELIEALKDEKSYQKYLKEASKEELDVINGDDDA